MVAAAVIGGAVIGAGASAYAGNKAAGAQKDASNQSIAFQRESRDQALALQAPQRNAGYAATAALMDMSGLSRSGMKTGSSTIGGIEVPDMSAYPTYDWQKNDPGYQFRLDQGNKALTGSLAARGGLLSGAAIKASMRYNQDYASSEYQNVYQRLAAIAGVGQAAAGSGANTVVNTGVNVGNALSAAGDARASSYVAAGNAVNGAINQIGQYYGGYGGGYGGKALAIGDGTFDTAGHYYGKLPGQ